MKRNSRKLVCAWGHAPPRASIFSGFYWNITLYARSVREKWGIKPAQKVRLIVYGNVLEEVPVRNIKEARGSLKGMSSTIEREEEDYIYKEKSPGEQKHLGHCD